MVVSGQINAVKMQYS